MANNTNEQKPETNQKTDQKIDQRTENLIKENAQKYILFAVRDADILWKKITKAVKENPDIKNWDDTKKIEYFYEDNKEFYKEFPIVSRYMITMGQYSSKAFQKYLAFKALDAKNLPAPASREPGYIEDKWVKREADYVMLLWKSYMKGKRDETQAKKVWQHAYDSLKKEFTDFRNTYKQTELKIKEENKLNQTELVKEVLNRISNSDKEDATKNIKVDTAPEHGVIAPKQTELELAKKRQLRDLLLMRVVEQRKYKVLDEIKKTVNKYDP
jgi:hypothetical protein